MDMMKTLCGVFALAALAALAGCGSGPAGPSTGAPDRAGGLTVEQALASDLDEPLLVRGALVAGPDEARLCDALAESYPPQCAGASLAVEGADVDALATDEAQGVRWAEDVRLLGTVDDGVLTVTDSAT